MPLGTLRRLYELYEIGGPKEVYRGSRDFIFVRTGHLSYGTYADRRADNRDRWEFIREYIVGGTLVDIGCAEGYFTRRSAEQGMFAIGIDVREDRLRTAVQRSGYTDGCGFTKFEITPENVHYLPACDTCLLLTVHHHWVKDYGMEQAKRMLEIIMDQCDVLVYEPPGDRSPDLNEEIDPEESIRIYSDWLESTYGFGIDILDSNMFDYKKERRDREAIDNTRRDPVFVIDTSGISGR